MGVTRVRNGRRRVVQHAEPANGSKPHSLSHPLSSVEVTPFHPPHTQQPQALTYPSKCQSFGTSPTPHPLLAPPPASREKREDRENGNDVTPEHAKKKHAKTMQVSRSHMYYLVVRQQLKGRRVTLWRILSHGEENGEVEGVSKVALLSRVCFR